ncbi:tyrosine protein kinase [Pelomyxa schiedti]|nr:tyrosine protein kinase [Pelomyxa schiedti]
MMAVSAFVDTVFVVLGVIVACEICGFHDPGAMSASAITLQEEAHREITTLSGPNAQWRGTVDAGYAVQWTMMSTQPWWWDVVGAYTACAPSPEVAADGGEEEEDCLSEVFGLTDVTYGPVYRYKYTDFTVTSVQCSTSIWGTNVVTVVTGYTGVKIITGSTWTYSLVLGYCGSASSYYADSSDVLYLLALCSSTDLVLPANSSPQKSNRMGYSPPLQVVHVCAGEVISGNQVTCDTSFTTVPLERLYPLPMYQKSLPLVPKQPSPFVSIGVGNHSVWVLWKDSDLESSWTSGLIFDSGNSGDILCSAVCAESWTIGIAEMRKTGVINFVVIQYNGDTFPGGEWINETVEVYATNLTNDDGDEDLLFSPYEETEVGIIENLSQEKDYLLHTYGARVTDPAGSILVTTASWLDMPQISNTVFNSTTITIYSTTLVDCSVKSNTECTSPCLWCSQRHTCIAGPASCEPCETAKSKDVCLIDPEYGNCLFCELGSLCTSDSCPQCFQRKYFDCQQPACSWCNSTNVCMDSHDYCSYCSDLSNDITCNSQLQCGFCEEEYLCAPLNESTKLPQCCGPCEQWTTQFTCDERPNCQWCSSQLTCYASNAPCMQCWQISLEDCDSTPGCAWDVYVQNCSTLCVQNSDVSFFVSSFVEPNSDSGYLIKAAQDSKGFLYTCGESDGPFIAKLDSSATPVCKNTWDSTTGTVSTIVLDEDAQLFYIVGAGENTPLEVENAPAGLLVATSFNTIDASIIAFNIQDCTRYWSVRWGGPQEEFFHDLVIFDDGTKIILVSPVTTTFPLEDPDLCPSSYSFLLLFFDADWNMFYCYGTSPPVQSRIATYTEVQSAQSVNYFLALLSPDCISVQCDTTSGQWKCALVFIGAGDSSIVAECGAPTLVSDYTTGIHLYFTQKENILYKAMWGSYTVSKLAVSDFGTLNDIAQFSLDTLVLAGETTDSQAFVGYYDIFNSLLYHEVVTLNNDTGMYSSIVVSSTGDLLVSGYSEDPYFISTTDVSYEGQYQASNPIVGKFSTILSVLPCVPAFPTPIDDFEYSFMYYLGDEILWPTVRFFWNEVQFGVSCPVSAPQCNTYQLWCSFDQSVYVLLYEATSNTVLIDLPYYYLYEMDCVVYAWNPYEFVSSIIRYLRFWIQTIPWDPSYDLTETTTDFGPGLNLTLCCNHTILVSDRPLLGDAVLRRYPDEIEGEVTLVSVSADHFSFNLAQYPWLDFAVRATVTSGFINSLEVHILDAYGQTNPVYYAFETNLTSSWQSVCMNVTSDLLNESAIISIEFYFKTAESSFTYIDIDALTFAETLEFCEQPPDTSSSHQPKKPPYWSISIIIVGLLALSVGSGVTYCIFRRKSKTPVLPAVDRTMERLHFADEDQHEEFDLKVSQQVDLFGFPLLVSLSKMTFGLGDRQALIDTENTETFTVANPSHKPKTFKFVPPVTKKFSVFVTPPSGTLRKKETLEVTAVLKFHCSCRVTQNLILAVSPGKEFKPPESTFVQIPMSAEAKVSTRLDPEELTLFKPEVGEGSFGTVYRGEWRGMEVAIKLLKYQSGTGVYDDFKREVENMEAFRSPYIVNFIGAVHLSGSLSIVTEFLPLGSLVSCMKKQLFSPILKLRCITDCARGVAFLHSSSILHRDLKPDNLLMVSTADDAPIHCKLSDFGTSRGVNKNATMQQLTKQIGTPVFMAPEIIQDGPYSTSADVFSFAILVFQVWTEKEPYDVAQFSSVWKISDFVISGSRLPIPDTVPPSMRELISACWAQDPADRPDFNTIVSRVEKAHDIANNKPPPSLSINSSE